MISRERAGQVGIVFLQHELRRRKVRPDSKELKESACRIQGFLNLYPLTDSRELIRFGNAVIRGIMTTRFEFHERRLTELTIAILKFLLSEEELRISNSSRRYLGQLASQLGVSLNDLLDTAELVIGEMLREMCVHQD